MKMITILGTHGGSGVAYATTGLAAAAAADGRRVAVLDPSDWSYTAARLMDAHQILIDDDTESRYQRLRDAARVHTTVTTMVSGKSPAPLQLRPISDACPIVTIPQGAWNESFESEVPELADQIGQGIRNLAGCTGIDTIIVAGHRATPTKLLDSLVQTSAISATIGSVSPYGNDRAIGGQIQLRRRLGHLLGDASMPHIRNHVPTSYSASEAARWQFYPCTRTMLYLREAAEHPVCRLFDRSSAQRVDTVAGAEDDLTQLWYELDTAVI